MKVSLAYAFANGIVPKTEALENFVEETFSVMIEGLGIEDTGFDNWLQRESFSSDEPPSSLLNPAFVDLVKPDDGSVFFLFQNMCPPPIGFRLPKRSRARCNSRHLFGMSYRGEDKSAGPTFYLLIVLRSMLSVSNAIISP